MAYDLQAAQANLQDQVAKGWINQAQADAELNRLRGENQAEVASASPSTAAPGISQPLVTPEQLQAGGAPAGVAQITALQQLLNQQNALQQAGLNRFNEQSAFGSSQWVKDPTTGQLIRQTTLAPWEQTIYSQDRWMEMERNKALGDLLGRTTDTLQNVPFGEDFSGQRDRIEQALYDRNTRYMDERFSRQNEDFEQQMANRGVPPGSDLYNRLKREMVRGQEEQYEQARLGAITAGGEEQQRYQTLLGQQAALPINVMSGLLSQQRGFYQPESTPFTQISMQAPNLEGLYGGIRGSELAAGADVGSAQIGAGAAIGAQQLRNQAALQQQQNELKFTEGLLNQFYPELGGLPKVGTKPSNVQVGGFGS